MSETVSAAGMRQNKVQDHIQLPVADRFHSNSIVPGGSRYVKPNFAYQVISDDLVNDSLEVSNVGRGGTIP